MANQLGLVGSYGTAPVAALVFSGLSLSSEPLRSWSRASTRRASSWRMYVNAATFLASAWIVWAAHLPTTGSDQRPWRGSPSYRTVADGLLVVEAATLRPRAHRRHARRLRRRRPRRRTRDAVRQGHGGGRRPATACSSSAVFSGMAARHHPRSTCARRASLGRKALRRSPDRAAGIAAARASPSCPRCCSRCRSRLVLGAFVGVGWVVGYTLHRAHRRGRDPRPHLRPGPVTRRCRPRRRARRRTARRGDVRRRSWASRVTVNRRAAGAHLHRRHGHLPARRAGDDRPSGVWAWRSDERPAGRVPRDRVPPWCGGGAARPDRRRSCHVASITCGRPAATAARSGENENVAAWQHDLLPEPPSPPPESRWVGSGRAGPLCRLRRSGGRAAAPARARTRRFRCSTGLPPRRRLPRRVA